MYRSLSMYPRSADPVEVDEHVKQVAAVFGQSPGFVSCTTSVDALMGPGAKDGEFSRVVVVDFETLDDALNALKAESFHELRVASELLSPMHFLFECREI
jgi:hypothetical protein